MVIRPAGGRQGDLLKKIGMPVGRPLCTKVHPSRMPRACPGVRHARFYPTAPASFGCHGLAPGRLTLGSIRRPEAYGENGAGPRSNEREKPRGKPVASKRAGLEASVRPHGAARGIPAVWGLACDRVRRVWDSLLAFRGGPSCKERRRRATHCNALQRIATLRPAPCSRWPPSAGTRTGAASSAWQKPPRRLS